MRQIVILFFVNTFITTSISTMNTSQVHVLNNKSRVNLNKLLEANDYNPSIDIKLNLLVELTTGLGRCKKICAPIDYHDSKAELDDCAIVRVNQPKKNVVSPKNQKIASRKQPLKSNLKSKPLMFVTEKPQAIITTQSKKNPFINRKRIEPNHVLLQAQSAQIGDKKSE